MIVIFSIKEDCQSTKKVTDWLEFYKIPFKVINGTNDYNIDYINFINYTDFEFQISNEAGVINSNDVNYFWYRRGIINIIENNISIESDKKIAESTNKNVLYKIKHQLISESKLTTIFLHKLLQLRSLNAPIGNRLSKLNMLLKASELGLEVPETIITGESSIQNSLIKESSKKYITKNISQGVFIVDSKFDLMGSAVLVEEKDITRSETKIPPSLFQEYIDKDYDIRTMFINDKFFSCAILSQEDSKTKVDFRNYNNINPNKIVPIQLPIEVEENTKKLMRFYKLGYASIDFVYCPKKNAYVFLEANPIGQFLQFSIPCNYNIEKEIALYLKKKYYETKKRNIPI